MKLASSALLLKEQHVHDLQLGHLQPPYMQAETELRRREESVRCWAKGRGKAFFQQLLNASLIMSSTPFTDPSQPFFSICPEHPMEPFSPFFSPSF